MYRFPLNRILNIDNISKMMQKFIQKIDLMGHNSAMNRRAIVVPIIVLNQIKFLILVNFEQIAIQEI